MWERKPEQVADVLLRIDWEMDGERYPESTTVEKLPLLIASIDQQGGRVVAVRPLETVER